MLFFPSLFEVCKELKMYFALMLLTWASQELMKKAKKKGNVFVLNKFMLMYVLLIELKVLSTCMIKIKIHESNRIKTDGWMDGRHGRKVADVCYNQFNILGWEIISEQVNYY